MYVLITYDVATSSQNGPRRLRRVAKACLDYGQRVQYSVFECWIESADFVQLRQRLLKEIDLEQDSIRFYFLGKNWENKVEHHGCKPTIDLEGSSLVF